MNWLRSGVKIANMQEIIVSPVQKPYEMRLASKDLATGDSLKYY